MVLSLETAFRYLSSEGSGSHHILLFIPDVEAIEHLVPIVEKMAAQETVKQG